MKKILLILSIFLASITFTIGQSIVPQGGVKTTTLNRGYFVADSGIRAFTPVTDTFTHAWTLTKYDTGYAVIFQGLPYIWTGDYFTPLATGTGVDTTSLSNRINLKADIASPTFTGTVTIPTPFTLGATSVTTTGTRLNYLTSAGGTTGTTTGNIVFSIAPTFTGTTTTAALAATANNTNDIGSSGVRYKDIFWAGTATGRKEDLRATVATDTVAKIVGFTAQSGDLIRVEDVNFQPHFSINSSGYAIHYKRHETAKGAAVASGTDITLGGDGNVFHITGTTATTTISATGWQTGSRIVLIFDDAVNMRNNVAGTGASFKLAGAANFVTTTDDVLELVFDGTYWYEVGRSVN